LDTIYILAKVEAAHAEDIIAKVSKVEGVVFVHAVTGSYDIIVSMEGPNMAKLLSKSLKEISGIGGVKSTETLIAINLD
jgi:DNA-binding Lrp family transcriptional regulator